MEERGARLSMGGNLQLGSVCSAEAPLHSRVIIYNNSAPCIF